MEKETPIANSLAKFAGKKVMFYLVICYGIAFGIWGLAIFDRFVWPSLVGLIIGFLLGYISFQVISHEKTYERTQDMIFASNTTLGTFAIALMLLGLFAWGMRVIFFH